MPVGVFYGGQFFEYGVYTNEGDPAVRITQRVASDDNRMVDVGSVTISEEAYLAFAKHLEPRRS